MNRIFAEIVEKRGLDRDFLYPDYQKSVEAGLMPDMDQAVAAIRRVIRSGAGGGAMSKARERGAGAHDGRAERQKPILIYGDYDVDGVTASTVMYDALRLAGAERVEVMLPNRFTDGYGMSAKVLERARELGAGLVVTVDCGSGNQEIIAELGDAGIPTVVTDHHECGESLPGAVAMVNPKRRDVEVPEELRGLAGVGVAFKVAQALVAAGMIPAGQEKWLLDLVAVGTICDSMKLTGENRRLVYYGLKVLAKTRRPGLRELMAVAGVKKIDAESIGYQIGPRLNAAGRMRTPEIALKLLMTKSRTEAAARAAELNELNTERRDTQLAAVKEITERGVGAEPVIVEKGQWSEGVIGIIAGKLLEEYRRPACLLPEVERGMLKGSGRSFGEFSLAEALGACAEVIDHGGGHAEACGVTVAAGKYEEFKRAVNDYYKSLGLERQERFFDTREDLAVEDLGEVGLELMEDLRRLEPYGEGNAEPVFLLPEVFVLEAARLGKDGNHLRLLVRDDGGRTMKLMWFFAPEEYLGMCGGERVNVWVTLAENEFNGIRSVEGRVVRVGSVL